MADELGPHGGKEATTQPDSSCLDKTQSAVLRSWKGRGSIVNRASSQDHNPAQDRQPGSKEVVVGPLSPQPTKRAPSWKNMLHRCLQGLSKSHFFAAAASRSLSLSLCVPPLSFVCHFHSSPKLPVRFHQHHHNMAAIKWSRFSAVALWKFMNESVEL